MGYIEKAKERYHQSSPEKEKTERRLVSRVLASASRVPGRTVRFVAQDMLPVAAGTALMAKDGIQSYARDVKAEVKAIRDEEKQATEKSEGE